MLFIIALYTQSEKNWFGEIIQMRPKQLGTSSTADVAQ